MDDNTVGAALKRLPAVGSLLADPALAPLIERHGRALVTDAIRNAIDGARAAILSGAGHFDVKTEDVRAAAEVLCQRSLRRVINATGVIVHTNLGRAPLAAPACDAVAEIARGYSTLEMNMKDGVRGSRHDHVRELIAELTGAEDGIAVNNCAGALVLTLAALCDQRRVLVSRGELVEIGGGFRVPDVMEQSGAQMVELGTTNKVHLRDYREALEDEAGAILSIHRSNFAIVGFTAQPTSRELAELAHDAGALFIADVGSGLLVEYADLGPAEALVRQEPRPADVLSDGADVVMFSGDKLLGGPQAGIIAGRGALIEKIRRHPLARALRADKLSLAALESTLRMYRDNRWSEIPVLDQLTAGAAELTNRSERLMAGIQSGCNLYCEMVDTESVVGGGGLPLARLPSRAVVLGEPGASGRKLACKLREAEPPIIGRIIDDRVALDVRTISSVEIDETIRGVVSATNQPSAGV